MALSKVPSPDTLRLVLLGKTGVGKSATGNTLLGCNLFESKSSSSSVTPESNLGRSVRRRTELTIVDTPGIFDTNRLLQQVMEDVVNAVYMSAPGPHAFLIVIAAGRFTDEEHQAICKLRELFGPKLFKYGIVAITRADDLKRDKITLDNFVKEANPELKDIIEMCDNRCFALDNTYNQDSCDPRDLSKSQNAFNMLQRLVQDIQQKTLADKKELFYTIPDLEQTNSELQEEKRLRKEAVEQEVKQEQIELVGRLASKLNNLHFKQKELATFKLLLEQNLKNWLSQRQVTLQVLMALREKRRWSVIFDSAKWDQIFGLLSRKSVILNTLFVIGSFPFVNNLQIIYRIPTDELEKVNTVIAADDRLTVMLVEILTKLKQHQLNFAVPDVPEEIEDHFSCESFEEFKAKLETVPPQSISTIVDEFAVMPAVLEVPAMISKDCTDIFTKLKRRYSWSTVVSIVSILNKITQNGGSVDILDNDIKCICETMQADAENKKALLRHMCGVDFK